MIADTLYAFLSGALVVASALTGVFFLRFWREARDGLFLTFALAFWILALNWLVLAFTGAPEVRAWAYMLRLLAFLCILAAVIRKNLRSR